jgi:hypothetical protein
MTFDNKAIGRSVYRISESLQSLLSCANLPRNFTDLGPFLRRILFSISIALIISTGLSGLTAETSPPSPAETGNLPAPQAATERLR